MLTIRNEQLRALGVAARHAFEERMTHHLRKFFPGRVAATDTEELIILIQHGCDRAATHGFKSERDFCKYIDLMIVLGRDFDVDGRHPWVSEVLNRTDMDRAAKMRAIVAAALDRCG